MATTEMIELDEKALANIEEAVQLVSLNRLEAMPAIRRTMVLAKGVQQLRQLLSGQTLKDIMALRGTKLVFRTDKDSSDKPYPNGVIRDALIEGRLGLVWSDALALAVAVAILLAGRWVFLRLSPHFEDFV